MTCIYFLTCYHITGLSSAVKTSPICVIILAETVEMLTVGDKVFHKDGTVVIFSYLVSVTDNGLVISRNKTYFYTVFSYPYSRISCRNKQILFLVGAVNFSPVFGHIFNAVGVRLNTLAVKIDPDFNSFCGYRLYVYHAVGIRLYSNFVCVFFIAFDIKPAENYTHNKTSVRSL